MPTSSSNSLSRPLKNASRIVQRKMEPFASKELYVYYFYTFFLDLFKIDVQNRYFKNGQDLRCYLSLIPVTPTTTNPASPPMGTWAFCCFVGKAAKGVKFLSKR